MLVVLALMLLVLMGRAMAVVQSRRTSRRRRARLTKKEKRGVTTVGGGGRGRRDGCLSFPRARFVARGDWPVKGECGRGGRGLMCGADEEAMKQGNGEGAKTNAAIKKFDALQFLVNLLLLLLLVVVKARQASW